MKLNTEMAHVLRRFIEVLDKGHLDKALKTHEFEMLAQALDGWKYVGRAVLSDDPCGEKVTLTLQDILNRRMAPERLPDIPEEVLYPGCELWTTTHGNRWVTKADANGEWWYFPPGKYHERKGAYGSREETEAALKAFVEDPAKVSKGALREWFRAMGFKWLKPTEAIEDPTCECGAKRPATLYWNKERTVFCEDCLIKHLRGQ